jgi:hypothetical protein
VSWGTVTVGRLVLRETVTATPARNALTGERTLSLTGEESCPPLTTAQVAQRAEDLLGLLDRFVPVTFTDKTDLDGFYLVADVGGQVTDYQGEVVRFAWTMALSYVGPANAVDVESRLTGTLRANDFSLTGERWHAPAGGHLGYYTGTTTPSGTMDRTGADGAITVYRGVPASVSPRWGTTLSQYGLGRVRLLVDDVERTGTGFTVAASASWELGNSLVAITPGASGTFDLLTHDGSAWRTKGWNVSVGASASGEVTSWDGMTVLRNDYETATVRLVKGITGGGRTLLDLTVRRGSRVVEGYVQTSSSTILSVWSDAATGVSASAGYVVATSDDADGNRATAGSARSFTALTTQGGLYKTSTTTLDFYLGTVVGGSAAEPGDVASVLRDQYATAMAMADRGVKR